jgi:hypothetical protein
MSLKYKFKSSDLKKINTQSVIYVCACPAQVSHQILQLREIFEYQTECLEQSDTNELGQRVHSRIAEAIQQAQDILEECLDDVLTLEGWERKTMTMPEGLRQIIRDSIEKADFE